MHTLFKNKEIFFKDKKFVIIFSCTKCNQQLQPIASIRQITSHKSSNPPKITEKGLGPRQFPVFRTKRLREAEFGLPHLMNVKYMQQSATWYGADYFFTSTETERGRSAEDGPAEMTNSPGSTTNVLEATS